MTTFWLNVAWGIGGYVVAVFTWDKLHTFFVGAQVKINQLRQQVSDLEKKIRGL